MLFLKEINSIEGAGHVGQQRPDKDDKHAAHIDIVMERSDKQFLQADAFA